MATITERIKQFLNDILENRQLEKVQKDASAIQGMRNPSEAVQRVVIRADAYNIRYSNGIRLLDQPSECIEKILSGKKVEFTTNSGKGYLTGLCKTPLGWGLTIGKQIQSSTDSSVTL
ncbi:hypothetical protein J8L04_19485 [Bacteroides fragilis]|uniref:hypothetical protein n=1 Tax=Bacteroides fragilis TaxID=817 RepID=UPI002030F0DF|nr:hypothetical protein [Bacteroides fragilis]MCM0229301.1 hypothetical protein [Bacteroides fragilis]